MSDSIKKLKHQGRLTHAPYGTIELTPAGSTHAVDMVRRHRLLETFLVQVLGYGWDEVHDEAEVLEHAVSDTMIERIDQRLRHPTRDQHGDPIPSADGRPHRPTQPCGTGRWNDGRADLRRRSRNAQILLRPRPNPGCKAHHPPTTPLHGRHRHHPLRPTKNIDLGPTASNAIWVTAPNEVSTRARTRR